MAELKLTLKVYENRETGDFVVSVQEYSGLVVQTKSLPEAKAEILRLLPAFRAYYTERDERLLGADYQVSFQEFAVAV